MERNSRHRDCPSVTNSSIPFVKPRSTLRPK
jgi:hypothetical protein